MSVIYKKYKNPSYIIGDNQYVDDFYFTKELQCIINNIDDSV